MKNSTFIGLLLTLVMLLIVTVAAFFFLFPRQQTLSRQNADLTTESTRLRQDLAESGLAMSAMEATREVEVAALATSEANGVILAGELVNSDQELSDLQSANNDFADQLAEASTTMADLQVENQRMKAQFPFAAFVTPEDGAISPPGESVDILVAAYDPLGITAVNLTLDEETQSFEGNDDPFYTRALSWNLVEEGEHILSLMAINVEGEASEPISVTVQIIDIEALNATIRSDIENNVIELTDLPPISPIDQIFLTQAELRQRITEELAEDTPPEELRRDTLVLSTFDFVEPDYDMQEAILNLLSEGVLGYYDTEKAEFVIISDDPTLDATELLTYAHEFVHALQDQYFELNLIEDENMDSEAKAALRALAEGHASLVELLYLSSGYFSEEEVQEIALDLAEEDNNFLDDAPAFLLAELEFPYTAGLEFVMALYEGGGFDAVDAAWSELPQSTEQILHPDRYTSDDVPETVTLPPLSNILGIDWQLLEEDTFGEFYLRQYLSQQLNSDSVDIAATGWGGDRYAVYENATDGTLLMVLRLAWDTMEDTIQFREIYPQYPAYLFDTSNGVEEDGLECWTGPEEVICINSLGEDSLIVRAPDVALAILVAAAFE